MCDWDSKVAYIVLYVDFNVEIHVLDRQTDRQTLGSSLIKHGQVTLPGASSLTLVPLCLSILVIGENEPSDAYRNYQPGRRMMMAIRMQKIHVLLKKTILNSATTLQC